MILQETVTMLLTSRNVNRFESLHYPIPRRLDKHNRLTIPVGTTIEVQVKDLMPWSSIKVLVKCDNPECTNEPKMIDYCCHPADRQYLCKHCAANSPERIEKLTVASTGRTHKPESILLMIENNWSSKHPGKLSPLYNPNLTDDDRKHRRSGIGIGTWKRLVKQRDNFTCQCCNYIGTKNDNTMIAHHKNDFKHFEELRTNVDNGVCICEPCHLLLHKLYGKYPTEADYEEFIKSKRN